jgi:tol-pal system protein YbgF
LRRSSSKEDVLLRTNHFKRWIIFFIVLLLFGCASTRDIQILDREIDKLYSEIQALKKEQDSNKNEMSALKNEMSTLKPDLSSENQKFKTDLLLRVENLQSEIRILSSGVEEYKEFSKRPSRDLDRVRGDMEGRLKILEERGKTYEERHKAQEVKIRELEDHLKGLEGKISESISKQAGSEKPISKEPLTELKGVPAGMGDLYKEAYETLHRGDLEGGRRKFEAFLRQYPNTELSDNAQFWIGETYYLKKDFERAILEYEKAIVKYPEGDKISAALFKQALAFLELGDKANARNLLKRVIEKYPQTDQAEMAKKKLETIK